LELDPRLHHQHRIISQHLPLVHLLPRHPQQVDLVLVAVHLPLLLQRLELHQLPLHLQLQHLVLLHQLLLQWLLEQLLHPQQDLVLQHPQQADSVLEAVPLPLQLQLLLLHQLLLQWLLEHNNQHQEEVLVLQHLLLLHLELLQHQEDLEHHLHHHSQLLLWDLELQQHHLEVDFLLVLEAHQILEDDDELYVPKDLLPDELIS
jgi:hypothetical protein